MFKANTNIINSFQANNNSVLVAPDILQQLKDKIQLLTRRNKKLRTIIKKDNDFKKSIGKTFHDLQSPLLSINNLATTNGLPEDKRIALKSATINAMDITNEALTQFTPRKKQLPLNSKRQPVLVSAFLSEIVADRKLKYKNSAIKFEYKLNNLNAFLFIKISPSDFKRSISNLINNALDALPDSSGTIKVTLKANEEWVYVDIWDDGVGMPDKVLQKLKNATTVTHGKAQGHGLGMVQVHDTLKQNYGEINIVSSTQTQNHGTTIQEFSNLIGLMMKLSLPPMTEY